MRGRCCVSSVVDSNLVKLLSALERSKFARRGAHVEAKTLAAEARRIALTYKKANEDGEVDSHTVGARKTQRLAVAPRFRALSVLKRETYRLACLIRTRLDMDTLCRTVILRDEKWSLTHRPRHPTAIDWTLRLVRGALVGKAPGVGTKVASFLFDDTLLSRMGIELNFAYRHRIDPECVTMFVDELGGFEIIAAKEAIYEYDFRGEEWVLNVTARDHPLDKLELSERQAIWARYSLRVSESDQERQEPVVPKATPKMILADDGWDEM